MRKFLAKKRQSKDLFIFDVDGTLVDAYTAIEKSLNFTLKKLGYSPVGIQKVKRNVGHGEKRFIQYFFRKADYKKALNTYRKHHKVAIINFSKLKPHARRVLESLKRKNKSIAVASNRPKYSTGRLPPGTLRRTGIRAWKPSSPVDR